MISTRFKRELPRVRGHPNLLLHQNISGRVRGRLKSFSK